MKKQTNLLLPIGVVVIAALAFAGWRMWGTEKSLDGNWPELDGGVYAEAVRHNGQSYLVPPNEIYDSGLKPEDRPALTDPEMADITTADVKLADDLEGIAVSVGGVHRFYPFQILNWHEIVNDEVNGVSLVVTYSALTGSAVVYEDDRHFSDAGQVYNNAMLMKADGDETLWNQTTGQAVVGEEVGQRLKIYPSTVMSWTAWKELYPSGLALSTETGYSRDYGRHPYASYETSESIFFPLNYTVAKMEPKDVVYRVDAIPSTDAPVVFLDRYLPAQEDANEVLGSEDGTRPIVAFYDEDTGIVRAYLRILNFGEEDRSTERELTFTHKGGVITDNETGSRWSPEGVAISGELRGETLVELPVTRHYAFAHFAMYPDTIISGEELLPSDEPVEEGETLEIN